MKTRSLLSILLCILLLVSSVCGTAASAEIINYSETECSFETFEDLKELAAKEYTNVTNAIYVGEGPLVISENLEIPDGLCIDAYGKDVIIESGVTLDIQSSYCYLDAKNLTVEGTLQVYYLYVQTSITVNGYVYYYGFIDMDSGSSIATSVTGTGKIINGNAEAFTYYYVYVNNFEDIKYITDYARSNNLANFIYLIIAQDTDIIISESIEFPPNTVFYTDNSSISNEITIMEGCMVALNGSSWEIYSPVTVFGIVNNHKSTVNVYADEGAEVIFANGGYYIDDGDMAIYSERGEVLKNPFEFFSVSNRYNYYYYTTSDSYGTYVTINHDCRHFYNSEVSTYNHTRIDSTCSNSGYTIYSCSRCGERFTFDLTPIMPNYHVYSDDTDLTCDLCGFTREINNETPPTDPEENPENPPQEDPEDSPQGGNEEEKPQKPIIKTTPMYRMYNPNSGEHFYTGSTEERGILVNAGWHYEGVAFNFPVVGKPVYRLYEPKTGEHLYTMDEAEKAKLLSEGWNYEGVAFNSAGEDEVAQYRLHNPNATCGAYHFTGSEEERDILIAAGWEYQGIGFYSCVR